MSRLPPVSPDNQAAISALESVGRMTGKASDMAHALAHAPTAVRFLFPFLVVLQRSGAGSVTDPRDKEMAILRTSLMNQCLS